MGKLAGVRDTEQSPGPGAERAFAGGAELDELAQCTLGWMLGRAVRQVPSGVLLWKECMIDNARFQSCREFL